MDHGPPLAGALEPGSLLKVGATNDDDKPATKGDVRIIVGAEIQASERRIRTELTAMEKRIILEIGNAVNTVAEQIGANATVVDEKYKDLPPRMSTVERQLGEHVADRALHRPPPAPRTARKTTKRKPKR